ncbi:MAG: TPM domain-containing protein [Prosthecobacter sp.]|uniref:TPM domain-containing protein n=1 Tax=Prosthecobacter sp. TaxID=1965333 RepID=UPI002611CBE7|nr:TPM domain-containing protein [Prosthecobacter sp.]MCF7789118.1 TPM domain-containing protein [Prosthecobacter sp.]
MVTMNADQFIATIVDEQVIQAIQSAEARTSGELRVFVTDKIVEDPMAEAWKTFARLKMQDTVQRNAVLIFVAPKARKFAIVADEGIHHFCQEVFWNQLAQQLSEGFKAGDYTGSLVRLIGEIGQALAAHFPRLEGDVNELPDDVMRD